MFGLTPDMILATAAAGQSVVFYPMVVRNWRRHYCHFPLYISALKIAFLVGSFIGFVAAGLPMAAAVVVVDVGAWIVLAAQRQVWGDGGALGQRAAEEAEYQMDGTPIRCRLRFHYWGAWHVVITDEWAYTERHCSRCLATQVR